MNPYVCSIIFGHKPVRPLENNMRDYVECRCGRAVMPGQEFSKWFGSALTPPRQRRRNLRRRKVALWGSLTRRAYGSMQDEWLYESDLACHRRWRDGLATKYAMFGAGASSHAIIRNVL